MRPELETYLEVFKRAAKMGIFNPWVSPWHMYYTEPAAAEMLGITIEKMVSLRKKRAICMQYVSDGKAVEAMYTTEEIYFCACEMYQDQHPTNPS
jgi:hypothetical protein